MIKYNLTRKVIGLEKHPLVIVEEYEDINKYILYIEREGEGSQISKITFEGNENLYGLINYLKFVLQYKDNETEVLYK